jgi:hypothetical protein
VMLNAGGSLTLNGTVRALGGFGSSGISGGIFGPGGSAAVTLNGNGITVGGVVLAQGGFGEVGGAASVTANAGTNGIMVQGGGSLICEFGCEVVLSDVKTTAVPRVGSGVFAVGGGGGNTGGTASAVLNTTGGIVVLGTTVGAAGGGAYVGTGGNALVSLTSGLDVTLASNVIAAGGLGGAGNGTGLINLIFLSSTGNYVVNGQVNVVFDDLTGSGFMVNGAPAILNENMFVTHGGPPPFTDVLVATINQQVDVLADQLKAGDTGESEDEKKKLPFCSS